MRMQDEELERVKKSLASSIEWKQMHAAHVLGRSGDPRAFQIIINLFRKRKRSRHAVDSAVDGLIEGAPATIPLLIPPYATAPNSPEGRKCGYVLGEIAYQTKEKRDPRIDAAVLDVLPRVVEQGTKFASGTVHILRECARAKPIPETIPHLWALLERSRAEQKPYRGALENALECLKAVEGAAIVPRLLEFRASVSPDHPLEDEITMFLEGSPRRS